MTDGNLPCRHPAENGGQMQGGNGIPRVPPRMGDDRLRLADEVIIHAGQERPAVFAHGGDAIKGILRRNAAISMQFVQTLPTGDAYYLWTKPELAVESRIMCGLCAKSTHYPREIYQLG